MTTRAGVALALLLACPLAVRSADQPPIVEVAADPAALRLNGPNASWSLLLSGKTADGRVLDLTGAGRFESSDSKVAAVSPAGVVRAVGDGSALLHIEAAGRALTVPVTVTGSAVPRVFHFENDIVPLLGRFGCNSAGCHGKAEGQNGFKLSVFGFDPAADYTALIKEGRGRRIFPGAPEHSLLLRKASGSVPHGGGLRIPRGSPEYETLRGWVAAGAPFGDPSAPHVI